MSRIRLFFLAASLALLPLTGALAQQSVTLTDASNGVAVTMTAPSGFALTCTPPCTGGGGTGTGGTSVSVSPNPVVHGQPVTVKVQNGLGGQTDYIAVGPSGTVNPCNGGACTWWAYLNGSHTAPTVGSKTATLTFTAPASGSYDVHLFALNSSTDESPVVPMSVQ